MTRSESGDGVDDGAVSTEHLPIPEDRSSLENAQLALLLEVAATPTPGCVDREREYPDLRFEHFLAGAVGARPGLAMAADGEPVGASFERAVRGMSRQTGGNTQFGALLLVIPLLAAATRGECTPDGVRSVVSSTTVEDAVHFYRAFEHVDVFVDEPPDGADDLDARRGADAIDAVRDRGVTLADVMALGDRTDDDAREWTAGFPRSFRMAEWLSSPEALPGGSSSANPDDEQFTDRATRAFLAALAERPDTLVAKKHGLETAKRVRDRAAELRGADRSRIEAWADELVASGINPGTTADVLAAGFFIGLDREWVIV
jgi:triphosphoribosyl-dephospho-CoA synthase